MMEMMLLFQSSHDEQVLWYVAEYVPHAQSYFKQYILKFLSEKTLSICKKDDDDGDDVAVPLSSHDEQVLRYVAGYEPHALSKKYGKINTTSRRMISTGHAEVCSKLLSKLSLFLPNKGREDLIPGHQGSSRPDRWPGKPSQVEV